MWDGVSVVAPVPRDGSLTDTPGISSRDGTNSTWSHGDIKNSLRQTGESETTSATKQYDAFGNHVASSGSWSGPFQYGGHFGYQTDPDSNLKLLGHRYYDPSTGRFSTRDVAKYGNNWYRYCNGDPVGMTDPVGLFPAVLIWNAGDPKRGERPSRNGPISRRAAINIRTNGGNVLVTGLTWADAERVAREIEHAAHPTKPKRLDPPHGDRNYFPHWQSKGAEGHTWFSGRPRPKSGWVSGTRSSGGAIGVFFTIAEGAGAGAEGIGEAIKWRRRIQQELDEIEAEAMRGYDGGGVSAASVDCAPLLDAEYLP